MAEKEKKKSQTELVHKVTLSTKRVVLLRDYQIRHQKMAARIAGAKAGNNTAYLALEMQEEILKQLIVEVDGKKPSSIELESMDDLFTPVEYNQLMQVLSKLVGGGDVGEPQVEIAPIGAP